MKNLIVTMTVVFAFSTQTWAVTDAESEKISRIYESDDFREKLTELHNMGFVIFKLDEVMDRSKSEMKPRATQNVHVTLSVDPSAISGNLHGSATLYDAEGIPHLQPFSISSLGQSRWEWTVGTNKGALNLGEETSSRISFPSLGLAPTFHFKVDFNKSNASEISQVEQDGYTRGTFAGWTDGPDSNHREAIYSNGESQIIEFKKQ